MKWPEASVGFRHGRHIRTDLRERDDLRLEGRLGVIRMLDAGDLHLGADLFVEEERHRPQVVAATDSRASERRDGSAFHVVRIRDRISAGCEDPPACRAPERERLGERGDPYEELPVSEYF